MRRVTGWIARHDVACYVNFDRFDDNVRDAQNLHTFHQPELLCFLRMLATRQFFYYRRTREQTIALAMIVPPIPRPFPTGNGFRILPFVEIEAGNGRFDVNRFHNHPTLPSRLTPSSFCASTANSIGSSRNTSLQKPFTIIETASSAEMPRCLQ